MIEDREEREVEVVVYSTPGELDEFIQRSTIWTDLKNELNYWISQLHMKMELADNFDEVKRYRGSLEAIRNFLALPEVLRDQLLNNVEDDQ